MPALIAGTSSEHLGRRPLRRILRERPLVFVVGPRGAGKTSVGMRIAADDRHEVLRLDTRALNDALVDRARHGVWSQLLLEAPALLLDGPVFLRSRQGVVPQLAELLSSRREAGRRTVVCEVNQDRSATLLMSEQPCGSAVVVALRYPQGRPGRMRFARRMCDELGLPRSSAAGTDALEPWGYGAVMVELRRRKDAAVLDLATA